MKNIIIKNKRMEIASLIANFIAKAQIFYNSVSTSIIYWIRRVVTELGNAIPLDGGIIP